MKQTQTVIRPPMMLAITSASMVVLQRRAGQAKRMRLLASGAGDRTPNRRVRRPIIEVHHIFAVGGVCRCRECFEHLHARFHPHVIGDADLNARSAGGNNLVEQQVAF